jgi:hypothetical protein
VPNAAEGDKMHPVDGDEEKGGADLDFTPRMPQRYTNAIGHPVQSRGLSPNDRTPMCTLLIAGAACLVLGKAFLHLQANYEKDLLSKG